MSGEEVDPFARQGLNRTPVGTRDDGSEGKHDDSEEYPPARVDLTRAKQQWLEEKQRQSAESESQPARTAHMSEEEVNPFARKGLNRTPLGTSDDGSEGKHDDSEEYPPARVDLTKATQQWVRENQRQEAGGANQEGTAAPSEIDLLPRTSTPVLSGEVTDQQMDSVGSDVAEEVSIRDNSRAKSRKRTRREWQERSLEEDHAHCKIRRANDEDGRTEEGVPDFYEEVHCILETARKHYNELLNTEGVKASMLRGAKNLVFQVAGYCRKADALRQRKSEARSIETQANEEEIAEETRAKTSKDDADQILAEIRLAGANPAELAEIVCKEWPSEAFVATKMTTVSIQNPRETRAIIVREGNAYDEKSFSFWRDNSQAWTSKASLRN